MNEQATYALCATRKGESTEEIIAVDAYPMHEGELRLAALVLDAKGYDRVRQAELVAG